MSTQNKKKNPGKEVRSKLELNCPDLDRILVREISEFIEGTVISALEKKKDLLIAAVSHRIKQSVEAQRPALTSQPTDSIGDWIGIDSLSRLRAIVGGRFQNLKARWIGAGFPLREHRGDKDDAYTLNQDGWIELSSWIAKQGFEIRQCREDGTYLFEIKSVPVD